MANIRIRSSLKQRMQSMYSFGGGRLRPETTIQTPSRLEPSYRLFRKGRRFWNNLGPGLTTGAADDDPSGIATYSQAGASQGYGLLWMAAFTLPLMAVIQEMCARIALVTGRGLAANIRIHFSKAAIYVCAGLLLVSNTFNIGADLGAMAEAVRLFFPHLSVWVALLLLAGVCILLELYISYRTYSVYLKWLTLVLGSYILAGIVMHFDLTKLLVHAFIPNFEFSRTSIMIIAAILGTTISPYLFFWQTSQEVEEGIANGDSTLLRRKKEGPKRIPLAKYDVWFGMFFSNLVMFFIIAVCAETLFKNGIRDIGTAAEAASALRPVAGNFAYVLFAFGIIGTGFIGVPVLAGSSAYALSETFKWREGLYRKPGQAKLFYGVIVVSVVLGLVLNAIGLNPIKALIYSAILNGLISPVMVVFIVLLAGNKKIMGEFRSSAVALVLGWFLVLVMVAVAAATLFEIL